jgi:hypothetical protein
LPNPMVWAATIFQKLWPSTTPRRLSTTVPRTTKRQQFEALLSANQWTAIHAAEWELLRQSFSESSLREWLAEAGIPVDQPYRGVQTETLEALESSLRAMTELYERVPEARKVCRTRVISAKDRTRFASKNQKVDAGKRALKAEMVEWMLVWLDDPAMFPSWATIRKRFLCDNSLSQNA